MESCDLDQRQQATDDQRSRDEVLLDIGFQVRAGFAAEDDGRCDDARQHGERVLEPEDERKNHWHLIVEAEEGRSASSLLAEWQARCEEELVVVVSDEAMFGEEGAAYTRQTRADRLLLIGVGRSDLGGSWFVHCGGKLVG